MNPASQGAVGRANTQSSVQGQADVVLATHVFGEHLTTVWKRLAERGGITAQTIEALPFLGDLCPISPKYRELISSTAAGDGESKDICFWNNAKKLVMEIGLGKYPIEDDLKKFSWGENVLGLFSAFIPFLDDVQFAALIHSIYEHYMKDGRESPGRSQTKSLKSQLDPFILALKIPEKVEYWASFLSFQSSTRQPIFKDKASPRNPFSGSFPALQSLPSLLEHVLNLVQEESSAVINIYGAKGAAWVAFYCYDILGLGICVISKRMDSGTGSVRTVTLPIGCDSYLDAKLHFFVDSAEAAFSIHYAKAVADLIHEPTDPLTIGAYPEALISRPAHENQYTRCVYDCDRTNFLLYNFPDMNTRPDLDPISHFVAAHTLRNVAEYVHHLDSSRIEEVPVGFTTYFRDALPYVQERSILILRVLGFYPKDAEFYQEQTSGTFSEHIPCLIDVQHDVETSFKNRYSQHRDVDVEYLIPLFWGTPKFTAEESRQRLRNLRQAERKSTAQIPPKTKTDGPLRRMFRRALNNVCREQDFDQSAIFDDDEDNSLFYVSQNAIRIASVLAFTDWISNRRLRYLSSDYFKQVVHRPRFLTAAHKLTNPDPYLAQQSLIQEAMSISTSLSPFEIETLLAWSQGWIGLQLPGIVVLRYLACPPTSKHLNGCLMSFHLGHITVEGEGGIGSICETSQLSTTSWGDDIRNYVYHNKNDKAVQPVDHFGNHEVHTNVTVKDKTAWIECEFLAFQNSLVPLSPTLITKSIYGALVSQPCDHPTETPLDKKYISTERPWDRFHFRSGFWFQQPGAFTDEPLSIIYQQVNQNPLGQWTASHVRGDDTHPVDLIYQRHSCLNCVLKLAAAMAPRYAIPGDEEPLNWAVFIVPDVPKVQKPPRETMDPLEPQLRILGNAVDRGEMTAEEADRRLIELGGTPYPRDEENRIDTSAGAERA